MLRVASQSGALIRESVDIMTSRVVYLAPVGTVLLAYDRRSTNDGSIRYRTKLGWLSEYRRDKERLPLVELLDMIPSSDPSSYLHGNFTSDNFLTFQQSAALAMGRIHIALKQVTVNLSRSIIAESPNSRASLNRSIALADGADAIVGSLTKIVRGLCDSAFENLNEDGCLIALRDSEGTEINTAELHSKYSDKKESYGNRHARREDDDDEIATESVEVDAATACLFLGAVMKYVVLPVIDDNSNFLNLFLLEKFLTDSALDMLIDCFSFVLASLQESLRRNSAVLDSQGRCALASISVFLTFLRRIVVKDSLNRSPSLALLPEKEDIFIRRLYLALASKLLPIYRSHMMSNVPFDLQKEWLVVTADLLTSLRTQDCSATSAVNLQAPENATFTPAATLLRSLMLMGFEENTIIDAATSLRSNSIEEVLNYIYRSTADGEQSSNNKHSNAAAALEGFEQKEDNESQKNEQLESFSEAIERRALNHVITVCDSMELLKRWSNQVDHIAPCIASFLFRLRSSPVASVNLVLNHLIMRIFASEPADLSFHTVLHLLLLLIRHEELDVVIDAEFLRRVYDGIMRLLDSEAGSNSLHVCVSPALLIVNELVLMFLPKGDDSSQENHGCQAETPDIVSFVSDVSGAEGANLKKLFRGKVEGLRLISLEQRKSLLHLLLNFLQNAEAMHMSNDTAHCLVLLLSTLVMNREIAFEFVMNDGWTKLLALPSSCSFRESSTLLALISRRCMETEQELKYSFALNIRSMMRASPSAEMNLEKFLEMTKGSSTRNPDAFFEVMMSNVKFVRRSNGKVMVLLQEEEMSLEKFQPDDQIVLTVGALVSKSISQQDDTTTYTATDTMEALGDCALALRSVPLLIIKHNCGGKSFISIASYIVRNILNVDASKDTSIFNRVKAAFRLMCVLSSYRGACRRCVLDSIIEGIVSATDSQYQANTKLHLLRHLGTLISYVVKSSKSKDARSSSHSYSNQNVCVDTVQYLVSSNLTQLLTNALSIISPVSSDTAPIFEALVEPLETITRPQLMHHLTKSTKPADNKANNSEEAKDEVFDNSASCGTIDGSRDHTAHNNLGDRSEGSSHDVCSIFLIRLHSFFANSDGRRRRGSGG